MTSPEDQALIDAYLQKNKVTKVAPEIKAHRKIKEWIDEHGSSHFFNEEDEPL